jgi:hypothetical protein
VWGRQDGSNGSSGETRVDDNFADWRSVQVKSRPWPLAQGIPLAFLFKANRTVPGLAGCHSNCPQVYQGDPGPQGTRPKRAPKIHISEIKTIFLVSAPRPRKVHVGTPPLHTDKKDHELLNLKIYSLQHSTVVIKIFLFTSL